MTPRSELGIEIQENVLDRYVKGFHHRHDPPPVGRRSAIEMYVEQEVGLVVQIRLRKGIALGANEARDFLAAFAYPWCCSICSGHEGMTGLGQRPLALDHEEVRRRQKQMDMAMLVDVVQYLEDSERISPSVLPAAKWLMVLNPRDDLRR